VGIATLPENGRTAGDLLIAADDAELAAKRLGKNRVCIANDLPDPMEHH
jgi:PleD family two-component response regulator